MPCQVIAVRRLLQFTGHEQHFSRDSGTLQMLRIALLRVQQSHSMGYRDNDWEWTAARILCVMAYALGGVFQPQQLTF